MAVVAYGAIYETVKLDLVLPLYAAGMIVVAAIVRGFPRTAPEARVKMESRLGAVGDVPRSSSRLRRFLLGLFVASIATSASYQFVGLVIRVPFLIGLSAGVAALIEIPIFRSSARLVSPFGLRTVYAIGVSVYTACLVVDGRRHACICSRPRLLESASCSLVPSHEC